VSQRLTRLCKPFNISDGLDALKFLITELPANLFFDSDDKPDHCDGIPAWYVAKRQILGQPRKGSIQDPRNEILSV